MGAALAEGIARGKREVTITLSNRSAQKADDLAARLTPYGHETRVIDDVHDALYEADVVILAVKPWDILPLLRELSPTLETQEQSTLVISLAAGVALEEMQACLPTESPCRLLRAMPNTPVSVGEGVTALLRGEGVDEVQMQLCRDLLASSGLVVELEREEQIHGLIALAGSSPAYFFELMDAMARVGEQMGISRELSLQMASQSMRGAAALQLSSGVDPKALRNAVTSPQGTTLAALRRLQARGVKEAWEDVLLAAHDRSREMEQEARV